MSSTNRGTVRQPDDFYATPAWATAAILPHLRPLPNDAVGPFYTVLEPACGQGAIVEVLRSAGVSPARLMLVEIDGGRAAECAARHGSVNVGDFLTYAKTRASACNAADIGFGLIITNPPFSLALEFIEAALSLRAPDGEVAMLLRLNFIGSQKRAAWHRAHPSDVYVLPKRPSFTPDGKTDSCEYAWFVWGAERGGRWSVLEVAP